VYPVAFAIEPIDSRRLYRHIFNAMLEHDYVEIGDLVIFTKGDLEGVSGGTNSMKIVTVTEQ
jgi:pyruvate kinase